MHKLNEEEGRVCTRRCGGQEIWIERTAFPASNGNQENWMDFRRVFKKLLMISKLRPVLKLAQLRSKLLEDAKKSITGIEEPAEASKLLDERYGDRHITILSAMNILQSVSLHRGPAHDMWRSSYCR